MRCRPRQEEGKCTPVATHLWLWLRNKSKPFLARRCPQGSRCPTPWRVCHARAPCAAGLGAVPGAPCLGLALPPLAPACSCAQTQELPADDSKAVAAFPLLLLFLLSPSPTRSSSPTRARPAPGPRAVAICSGASSTYGQARLAPCCATEH